MIRRREFLVLLASLTAVFGKAVASQPSNRKPANARNDPELLFHKGWVLRRDDLRDI